MPEFVRGGARTQGVPRGDGVFAQVRAQLSRPGDAVARRGVQRGLVGGELQLGGDYPELKVGRPVGGASGRGVRRGSHRRGGPLQTPKTKMGDTCT